MRCHGSDDGAIAILVAVLAVALFGLGAIVVDLGYARTIKSEAQSAVDAASLAGAGTLAESDDASEPFTAAIDAIKASALSNFGTVEGEWASCAATQPDASWVRGGSKSDCILFNRAVNPTKLQVVLPVRHVDSFLGGAIGYSGVDVGARAQATIREEDLPGCALCVRGLLDTKGAVRVAGGGSSSAVSGRVRPGGLITVQAPGAITFGSPPNPASGPYSPSPRLRAVNDPFEGSPMPSGGSGSPLPRFPDPASEGNLTCGPGGVPSLSQAVYRNVTVTATAAAPCTATGVIVITGRLRVRTSGYLSATSSVFQLSCGARTAPSSCPEPRAGGRLQIDPGGAMNLSGTLPTPFSVVADPNNTSALTINGSLFVDQAVYGRSTPVTIGLAALLSGSGRMSVASMTIKSGGAVTVTAPGGAPSAGPPDVALLQ